MDNMIFNGLATNILPIDGVKRLAQGIELTLKNPLSTVTLRDFKINKIAKYADIYINNILLTREHFLQISVIVNNQIYTLEELEQIKELNIPHKPHSKIILPSEFGMAEKIIIKMDVKMKIPLNFELTRKILQ